MRILMVTGAALILLGGIIIARGVHYTTNHNVVDLPGVVRVSVDEKTPVSPWIGGVIALVGLGLVFSGGSGKRRA